MSTYLELCQKAALECGVDNTGAVPTAVTSQRGNLLRVVEWVKDSWIELQNLEDTWRFMRSRFTVDTVDGTASYAYTDCTDSRLSADISRFSAWRLNDPRNPPKCYLTSGGVGAQYFLQFLEWDTFNALYRIGTVTEAGPVHITIDPQNNLVLGPTPNDVYTVTGDYQMSAQILAADDDEPDMPTQFHNLLVFMTMRKYGGFYAAQEVLMRATNEGGTLMDSLRRNQLPQWRAGRPLA